jgi:uncharacterized protein
MTQISLYRASAPVFVSMLTNLDMLLGKAEANAAARGFDVEILTQSRLAPDMLPLTGQIRIACDMAKNSMFRLAGQTPPVFEDNEKTFADMHARIARTIEVVKSLPENALDGGEDRDIVLNFGPRKIEFKGLDYLLGFVLPNLYFHITTAYAILRHNGVDVGKADFTRAAPS